MSQREHSAGNTVPPTNGFTNGALKDDFEALELEESEPCHRNG